MTCCSHRNYPSTCYCKAKHQSQPVQAHIYIPPMQIIGIYITERLRRCSRLIFRHHLPVLTVQPCDMQDHPWTDSLVIVQAEARSKQTNVLKMTTSIYKLLPSIFGGRREPRQPGRPSVWLKTVPFKEEHCYSFLRTLFHNIISEMQKRNRLMRSD